MTSQELSDLLDRASICHGELWEAELTDGWQAYKGIVPHPPRHSIPRRAMGSKRARELDAIGLGCTAEPRRAAP